MSTRCGFVTLLAYRKVQRTLCGCPRFFFIATIILTYILVVVKSLTKNKRQIFTV